MLNNIIDPITGTTVSLHSIQGKKLLKKYIYLALGGAREITKFQSQSQSNLKLQIHSDLIY